MASIQLIKGSDGSGNAAIATIQTIRAPLSSTIIVDTVVGINPTGFIGSMGTPHTFTDPITSETITVISEATAVDFAGHVDGSNLEIDTIAPGYTDAGSAVGDIVIIRPTTQWSDNVAETFEVSHNDDGTLKNDIVEQANIAPGAVGTTEVAPNSITSAKLAVALLDATPGSLSDIGTSNATGATLSVPAGTWFLIAKANSQTNVSQPTVFTGEIYNSTDAAVIDTSTAQAEYTSGTELSRSAIVNMGIVTLAATKTIIVRYRVDDATGTSNVSNIRLIAIPVGV